jgi:hypothetical protein
MQSPEQSVLLLNAIVIFMAYIIIYPRVAGNNFNKIAGHDLIASAIVLITAGSLYWNSGVEFNLLIAHVNWFWFTFITFGLIEIPVLLWYIKRHQVKLPR